MANRAMEAKEIKAARQRRGVFVPVQRFSDTEGDIRAIEGTKSFYLTKARAQSVGACDGSVVIQAETGLTLTREGRANLRATELVGRRQAKLDKSCGGDFKRIEQGNLRSWDDYATAREEVWPIVRR